MLTVSYLVEMDPVTLTDALDPKCSEHIEIDSVVSSILTYITASPLLDSKTQEGHDHTACVSPLSIIDLLHILKTLVEMAVLFLPYSKTLSNQISASRVLVSLLDWLDALAPAHSLDFDSSQLVDALISNIALVLCTTTTKNSLDLEDNYGYTILHGLIMDRGPNDLVILCAFSQLLFIFHFTRRGFTSLSVSRSHLFHNFRDRCSVCFPAFRLQYHQGSIVKNEDVFYSAER
ncbi:hypothetical protein BS47DRAFT_73901 [Hydnum rufescens UP504]|uniref:Uncharacterized protein n=1 Tax=Hydnum rufescens UP504 TaxID=1448309 RepID=A0A9P6B7E5_9AGAM|nr:hypothetical protein BS47DRAFT_73901 [Hydnum rufescens UP504]